MPSHSSVWLKPRVPSHSSVWAKAGSLLTSDIKLSAERGFILDAVGVSELPILVKLLAKVNSMWL